MVRIAYAIIISILLASPVLAHEVVTSDWFKVDSKVTKLAASADLQPRTAASDAHELILPLKDGDYKLDADYHVLGHFFKIDDEKLQGSWYLDKQKVTAPIVISGETPTQKIIKFDLHNQASGYDIYQDQFLLTIGTKPTLADVVIDAKRVSAHRHTTLDVPSTVRVSYTAPSDTQTYWELGDGSKTSDASFEITLDKPTNIFLVQTKDNISVTQSFTLNPQFAPSSNTLPLLVISATGLALLIIYIISRTLPYFKGKSVRE